MELKTLVCGIIQTNAYLISNPQSREAVLVDCPDSSYAPITRYLESEGLTLAAVILTHGHWDHISDTWQFQQKGIPVIGHPDIGPWLADPAGMTGLPTGFLTRPTKTDQTVTDGESLRLAGCEMTFFHVPGHHPASLAVYIPDMNLCLTGDLIFRESVGRTDLGGGDFSNLENSIRNRIYTLSDDTVLLPGHGEPTSVRFEKDNNPFVSDCVSDY